VAKRCEIGPRLLLITNRKSHIDFQMTCKSLTLDDLKGYVNRPVFWLNGKSWGSAMVLSDKTLATP